MMRAILISGAGAAHAGARLSIGVDPSREGTILPAPDPISIQDLDLEVARTVADIFMNGMAAEASVP
jgi:hypothetical protein